MHRGKLNLSNCTSEGAQKHGEDGIIAGPVRPTWSINLSVIECQDARCAINSHPRQNNVSKDNKEGRQLFGQSSHMAQEAVFTRTHVIS